MIKSASQVITLRSKKWIIDALLELLNEKKYDQITIQNISERADLTRQTFYRHFKSKEDVLQEYITQLYDVLFEEVNKLEKKTFYEVFVTYFKYWNENRDFLELLKKSEFRYDPVTCYYPYVKKILATIENRINNENAENTKYLEAFILGGLGNIKNSWMDDNYQQSPEVLAEIIINLLGVN